MKVAEHVLQQNKQEAVKEQLTVILTQLKHQPCGRRISVCPTVMCCPVDTAGIVLHYKGDSLNEV
jgi:hypothetical protein